MQIQANSGVLLSEVEQQEMRRLLAAERRYTGYLVADTNSYVEQLLELDGTQRQLIADVELFAQYVDERVLWARNVETLSAADVPVAFEVVRHFAEIAPWRELGGALLADMKSHLALYCLILALAAAACAAGWLVSARRVRPPAEAERPNWLERVVRRGAGDRVVRGALATVDLVRRTAVERFAK